MALGQNNMYEYGGCGLLVFVVVFLIVFWLLTFNNPRFVRRSHDGHRTCQNDSALTILWSIFIALVILFLVGLLFWAFRC